MSRFPDELTIQSWRTQIGSFISAGSFAKRFDAAFPKCWLLPNSIINKIGCRKAGAPYEDVDGLYQHPLGIELCGEFQTCGLKSVRVLTRDELARIRDGLAHLPKPDAETVLASNSFVNCTAYRSAISHKAPAQIVRRLDRTRITGFEHNSH